MFLLVFTAHAQLIAEEEVYLQPYKSYLRIVDELKALGSKAATKNTIDYQWLLLRKAQAEDILYFHQQLEKTVAQAQKSINALTPAEITINFSIYQGIIAQRKANYQNAIRLLSQALENGKKAKLPRLYIWAKTELAYTRSLIESFQASLTDIQQAYVEAFTMDDQFLIAKINESYGAIYGYMEYFEHAIEYYQKALKAYQNLAYPSFQAEAIYGLAATYRDWKKFDQALYYYNLYKQAIDYTPQKEISFYAAYGIGMTLAEKGDCAQAIPAIDQALQLNGFIDYNAELYKRKAQCLLSQNKVKQAQQTLQKAIAIFNQLPELTGTHWQLEAEFIRAQIQYALNNTKAAYLTLLDYTEKNNQLLKNNASKKLLRIRTALELERRDAEIALLQQRAKVQLLQAQQQKQLNKEQGYIIAIISTLVLAIGCYIIILYRHRQRLAELSIRDPLTQLHNRRFIMEKLQQLLAVKNRNFGGFAVLMIDIDDFKTINDQYGHNTGDKVILQLTNTISKVLRAEDLLSRIGGDEFLCILPRSGVNESIQIAQRIASSVDKLASNSELNLQVIPSVSIGVYYVRSADMPIEKILSAADKAMYQAKALGKNRVYHAQIEQSQEQAVDFQI